MKEFLTENLISSLWTKFALLKENFDEMRFEPTNGERFGLAVQRLNHSATLSVQPSKYDLPFLFRFWFQLIRRCTFLIEIDSCWFFSYLDSLFGNDEILTENLISSLWTKFDLLKENFDEMRFEPTNGECIGLAVQRLNHSATLSVQPSKYDLPFLFCYWVNKRAAKQAI